MNHFMISAGLMLCTLPLPACGSDDPSGGDSGVGGGTDASSATPGMGIGGSMGGPSSTSAMGGGGSAAPVEWAGVFALDIPEPYWTSPPGIGGEIGSFVPRFLFNLSGTAVTLGTAHEALQDPCTPTQVPPAVVAKPAFALGPTDFQMNLFNSSNQARVNAIIRNLTITNILPPTDVGGTLTAVLDAREIYPLFHLLPDPDPTTVCSALASFGAPCEPCPQDGQLFCLTIVAERLEAVPAPEIAMGMVDSSTLGPACADFNPTARAAAAAVPVPPPQDG